MHSSLASASDSTIQHRPAAVEVLLTVTRRHRIPMLVLPVLVGFFVVGYVLWRPRTYTTHAAFTPRSSSDSRSGSLGGIAAQLGVAVPGTDPTQSADFFADVLTSDQILNDAVTTPYMITGVPRNAVTLVDWYRSVGSDSAIRRVHAVETLRRSLMVERNTKTGVVTFSVRQTVPALAVAVAQRLLELLNSYNIKLRQGRAEAELSFAEARVKELRDELSEADGRLAGFQARNRVALSPELEEQRTQLERDVSLRTQVFLTVSQLYEQARVDVSRDIPVIEVVEPPTRPVLPDSRKLALKAILAVGATAGLLIAALLFYEGWLSDRRR
jgi:uncharacterized protein involved in exopolysaccharide biosynthesis